MKISAFRRTTLVAPALLALFASLPTLSMAQQPKVGGTVIAVVNPEPAFLVSAHNVVGGTLQVSSKMFEGLLGYDLGMNLKPVLAEKWQVSNDGLSITFNLRRGVKWHDGRPFTSADVAFTAMKIWKQLHPRNRVNLAKLIAVDTPDANTAIFRLSEPAPFLLSVMNGNESQVVPKHIYDTEDIGKALVEKEPVGTGPFRFKEWKRGTSVTVEKNPDYWQKGKPYLDRIIYRVIPDEAARAVAFETGEVHFGSFGPVSTSNAVRLSKLPTLAVETQGYEWFGTRFLLELNTRRPIFSDRRVRQALSHAINRDFILDNIWFGFGTKSTGPVPSALKAFYTPDVPSYAYDPKKAEQLLDDAGHKRGADGVRFKMVHDYLPFGQDYVRTAEVLKQNFKAVGIDLEIRAQDTPTFLRRVYTDNDFDMTSNTLSALPDPTLGVQRVYWSKNIVKGVPFSNGSGYNNPEMDRVLEAAQSERDPAKRRELFVTMQKIAQTDLPVLDLFVMKFVTVYNKKLKNHTLQADGYTNFADAYLD
jgi:peptide/nickel transport system substrate-binding protein